jgi:hypothetical protein
MCPYGALLLLFKGYSVAVCRIHVLVATGYRQEAYTQAHLNITDTLWVKDHPG